ncbi:MAG TPA: hypothetical protein VFQ61_20305 [Polyangiaceae bacterium]|nr:hypothetical protein [Polyangiaceae bacterium]
MNLIFSIAPSDSFDLGGVIKSAYRYLDGSVTVLQEMGCVYDSSRRHGSGHDAFGTSVGFEKPFGVLFLISLKQGGTAIFRVTPRPSTPADFESAKAAAGKSGETDLGEIAVRCQTVWEVVGDVAPEFNSTLPPTRATVLGMCAVLAAVARGSILLEDGSLLDAKSAWERLAELLTPAA